MDVIEKTMAYTSLAKEYLALTKPGIVTLVLITTLGGFYIGSKGNIDGFLVFWTLAGTGLAAAGSAVINMVLDRDLDSLMERTSSRPLPKGSVGVSAAMTLGLFLVLASFLVMFFLVNSMSAFLTVLASFSYVVLYTILLKRKTPVATEIGGISGALPPVIGYAAATGFVDVKAFVLFLIMFMWQPPHFWALAIKYKDDYSRAGVPALPVVRGVHVTRVKTLLYTVSLLPLSLLPYLVGIAGKLYFAVAGVSSAIYVILTVRLLFSTKKDEMKLFFFSIIYIAIVFSAMILDLVK